MSFLVVDEEQLDLSMVLAQWNHAKCLVIFLHKYHDSRKEKKRAWGILVCIRVFSIAQGKDSDPRSDLHLPTRQDAGRDRGTKPPEKTILLLLREL